MKIDISTRLGLKPEVVWKMVQTPELLMHIAAPLVKFRLLEPAVATAFNEGDRFLVAMTLFGFLPFGTQWIIPSIHIDPTKPWPKRMRDNGYSALVSTWDHWISVEPDTHGGTVYRDTVEVDAGLLTPLVWMFAQIFYRHRQSRWRALAQHQSTAPIGPSE